MRKIILFAIALLSTSLSFARDPKAYEFFIDLNNVSSDRLFVTLYNPKIQSEEINYYFPKIVPGTYDIYDFGRFVSGFKAYDKDGKELAVVRKDVNTYVLKQASRLDMITYYVDDTWDSEIKESFVFEPGGTNIEAGKNFVINTHGFFGYFEGMKYLSYNLNITKPKGFYGASGISSVNVGEKTDVFTVGDYISLVDNPIMYCIPDTSTVLLGKTKVMISVYSPNKKVSSKFLAEKLSELLEAQRKYLGGVLPVNNYAFLIYLTDKESKSGGSGALEHSFSSMYFLPEMDEMQILQMMRDVAAHEFFHIVTPLNIHSKEIGDFDFINPKMSKHLWLYEGVTEYAAGHVQVKYGLIEKEAYLNLITEKMQTSDEFNDTLPFTVMSKGCLKEYKKEYINVYQKGALIGMCLDIKLLEMSDGKYDLQQLLRDLSKKYGMNRSFDDDSLFYEIEMLSGPQITEFIKKYIDGSSPLPFKEVLDLVGINYTPEIITRGPSLGGMSFGFNPTALRLYVMHTEKLDEFGKSLGYQEGDELYKFNGKKLELKNIDDVLGGFLSSAKEGQSITVVVLRKVGGKEKKVKLKSKVIFVDKPHRHNLKFSDSLTDRQKLLQEIWLGKNGAK